MAVQAGDALIEVIQDLFQAVEDYQGPDRESRIAARNKHMPQICLLLGFEFKPMAAPK